jgi:hypothetical protein
MARKGWSSLSGEYRKRLEKNGISKKDYESGASIQSARGHSKTPERPIGVLKPSQPQFAAYVQTRQSLVTQIVTKKELWFSSKPTYNIERSLRAFRDYPPSMADLRRWAALTREEWVDAIRESRDTARFLGYQ